MKPQRTLGAACALLAVVALAACGSSTKSSSANAGASSLSGAATPGATSSPASTPAPAGAAFKLGFICSCTGPGAAALAQEGDVIKAWASSVNAGGGVNGHPVSVAVADDGNNPATALLASKQMIADKVIAIIDGSTQDAAFAKQVAAAGIPVVGGLPIQAAMFTNPDFFPSGAVLPSVIMGQVIEAKAAGKTHMGVAYCTEVPVCAQLVGLVKASAAVVGGFQVSGSGVSMSAPSYTAPCLALKGQGVDTLFSGVVAPAVVRIADACAQQAYKPTQVNQAPTSASNWLKDANMAGTILIDAQAPWFATSIPAVKAFTEALNKYAPGVTTGDQFGPDDLSPWTGGQLFEAAAKAGSLTPSATPADVTAALYKLKNETLGGLSGPLNYVKGKPSFPACYFVIGVQGGKFTAPKGTNYICPSQTKVVKLGTILATGG